MRIMTKDSTGAGALVVDDNDPIGILQIECTVETGLEGGFREGRGV